MRESHRRCVKCATWATRFFTCKCAERNELVKAVAGGQWYSVGRLLVFSSEMDCEKVDLTLNSNLVPRALLRHFSRPLVRRNSPGNDVTRTAIRLSRRNSPIFGHFCKQVTDFSSFCRVSLLKHCQGNLLSTLSYECH